MSFAPGPVTHHSHTYHHDPPCHHPRRRRRDHDDPYHPYLQPLTRSHPYHSAAAPPYHVPRDPLALSHLQERLFPPPPPHQPASGPPPPKRARRAPEPRYDPAYVATSPVVPAKQTEDSDTRGLLSQVEIERRSPSRKDGIDSALEARLRASYCAYLRCLGFRLDLPQTTIATAVVYCHRFFLHRSHACHDRFLVATAALFLAAKSEETTCLLNTVIRASCEVSGSKEFNLFPYFMRGPNWFEQYRENITQAEQMILTTLDFELEVTHPYASLSSALSKLGLAQSVLFNVAWNLINDGFPYACLFQFRS
ncbi:hypothetical protein BRADI_2g13487v3 [Brachypodium distachyon]|uniref:Cyclin-like domain-containing protein n=1 Tax=Brachypodium distachyon TaxID=15368 RepID=A0A0Q3G1K3_BRADI|nr:hypothetical protein BRADI_2g13487v3 [Brachypodium distachyon]